jgi:hypothetical protein
LNTLKQKNENLITENNYLKANNLDKSAKIKELS